MYGNAMTSFFLGTAAWLLAAATDMLLCVLPKIIGKVRTRRSHLRKHPLK